ASYIGKQSNLSVFNSYLVKTGLDKTLGSSKLYTVFAPTNDALASMDPTVVSDTAKLKAYLLNHISGQQFFTRQATDTIRVPLLNGKRASFYRLKYDEANITKADTYVRNGVLHTIDKGIAPMPSIWEYIQANTAAYSQNAYIAAQVYTVQDPAQAVLDSINPVTGDPVYKPGTGIVQINTFRTKVYDIANGDSLYTYVVVNNTAWTTELDREKAYFKSVDAAKTTSNSAWNTVKDLAIKGLYPANQLPVSFVSRFGVHIPISAANIVETRKASNGIIYVVNAAVPDMLEKIPTVIVQGETPLAFKAYDTKYITKIFYRQRTNPTTGLSFNDIYGNLGSSGANYYFEYITNGLYTTKYKVYWVALNDKVVSAVGDDPYGTDSTLQQILQIGQDTSVTYTPTFNVQAKVTPYTYTETYIGDYDNTTHEWWLSYPLTTPDGKSYTRTAATRRIRLQAPASAGTGIPLNLTLDYIKFVPVL
ncbi:MAG: fasciclin domain-containing protein, partial [Bacteroidetes bacterium]|nr:fasciclin domain-containing protein [Bacteroidota bacterium]